MIPVEKLLDKSNFERDGIVWPIRAIPVAEANQLERQYRAFQETVSKVRGREVHLKPHLVSTWLDEIVHNPIILDAVERVLGADILLWSSDFAVKGAGLGTWIPWHQDTPYWNLSTADVVSVWLAFTPATKANGAMRVVPGTHNSGALGKITYDGDPHEATAKGLKKASAGNLFSFDHIMDEEVDENQAVDVELAPGEFSIHHINLVHGGGPNESDQDRIGFVMRFISDATYCRSGRDSAMLVRGQHSGNHFELEPRVNENYSSAAMSAMEHALSFPSGFGDKDLKAGA
jgi:non-heme Fe2+,alpha-ketoglutarate-dependent halogenase